jgi:hypothetical protein
MSYEDKLRWLRIVSRNLIAIGLTVTFCIGTLVSDLTLGEGFIGIFGGVIGFYFKSEETE